ncbi:TetR/AcrR family transcriptional regulator [Gammaproteobacteria bacterium]|nr:TetR/AcrR family transcriptional regulator [Gammaproteobacteria bacterium]
MKSYHHGNLKQELILCACKLCEENGYETLSMRSIAKESGVSQTAPYRHFETKESLYASVAMEGFKKLSKVTSIDTSQKVTKKKLIETSVNYINFGLENANTYDLMFGTAVGDFSNYPELLDCANATYENMRLSFAKLANDSEEIIAYKCITLWSMLHGLVGILRKVAIAGVDGEPLKGPMTSASLIGNNLDLHLDKVLTGIIQN